MPKFSIIVPTYNAEPFLPRLFKSIQDQTFSDWELIFINDASRDNSLTLLKNWSQEDPRIYVLNLKNNEGQANARNQGIKKAKGEWILFSDSDDAYFIDALSELEKVSRAQKRLEVIYFNAYVIPHNKKGKEQKKHAHSMYFWKIPSFASEDKSSYAQALLDINLTFFSPWTLSIRREWLVEKNLNFENYCAEDWLFNWLLLPHRPRFYFLNEPLYKHYYLANTWSSTNQVARYTSNSRIFEYFLIFEKGKRALKTLNEWQIIEEKVYERGLDSILGQLTPFRRASLKSDEGKKAYRVYLKKLHYLFSDLPLGYRKTLLTQKIGKETKIASFLNQPLSEERLKKLIKYEKTFPRNLIKTIKEKVKKRIREVGAVNESKKLVKSLISFLQAIQLILIILKRLLLNR